MRQIVPCKSGVAALALWIAGVDAMIPRLADAQEATSADDLDERIRRLEAINQHLLDQYEAVLNRDAKRERQYQDLEARYDALLERIDPEVRPAEASTVLPMPPLPSPAIGASAVSVAGPEQREVLFAGPGRDYPDFPLERAPRLLGRITEGFELATPDEEFTLQFRVLNQVDFKAFAPNDLDPAISGLYLPRTRFYFAGQLTRTFQYEVSVQRSVEGVFDLLDAYLNARISEGFQLKFGRAIVPYSYDWYDHLEPYFITPERSLFPLNFGLSRQAGLTAWGYLGDGRLEYAIGAFSGGTNGVADTNTTRDAVGYVNWRPFLGDEDSRWRFLNLGGSIAGGTKVRPEEGLLPLRTSIQSTENSREAAAASITFLDFEEDVRALGDRFQGALHAAYYGGGWSLEAEFQAGRFQFAKAGLLERPHVPVVGYHLTGAYFLTGERVTNRSTVVPLRPLDPFHGQYGPGAIEAYARISQLSLGREVFDFELADARLWTNNVTLTDVGVNWYSNRFIKFYFDWQHSFFGSPVLLNAGEGTLRRESDLFWLRCQIFF